MASSKSVWPVQRLEDLNQPMLLYSKFMDVPRTRYRLGTQSADAAITYIVNMRPEEGAGRPVFELQCITNIDVPRTVQVGRHSIGRYSVPVGRSEASLE